MTTNLEIQTAACALIMAMVRALEAIADPENEDFDSHVRARDALKQFEAGEGHLYRSRANYERVGAAVIRAVKREREWRKGSNKA